MIHARPDYNRIQDPALSDPSLLGAGSTPIGEDEPVILFRAQDKHFIAVLGHYWSRINADEDMDPAQRDAIMRQIDRHAGLAEAWNEAHPTKTPDVPLPGAGEETR